MRGVRLEQQVRQRLRTLAPAARTVLVALSGGPDSVAALHLLRSVGVPVVAGHFDHGLRPESGDDAAFVAELCEHLDVSLRGGAADVAAVARQRGWNLEDAARRLRYAFLHDAARELGADVVLTAHTLDDQAETVLAQLLRGTAFATGMAPRRGRVVRPLLEVPRQALRSYLAEHGIAFRHDASNRDLSRTRAWLRSEVLPVLERRAPGAVRRLARTGTLQRDVEEALQQAARVRFGDGALRRTALLRAPAALQRQALAGLLEGAGARVDADRIERARAALARETPWRTDVGDGRVLRVAYGRVEVAERTAPPAVTPVTSAAGLPEGVVPAAVERYPGLVLRARRPGDRIRLPGGHKLVSDLLIDRKVPREARDGLRVLASGSDVLWVEGIGAGVDVAARPGGSLDPDLEPMRRALALARAAADAGELPVGAIVMKGGRVVGEGANRSETDHDPTAHAEVVALRAAAAALRDWRLEGATLYVTLEPCPMCLGAVLQTRIGRVVYGADNHREGALGGVLDLMAGDWKRRPEVRGGVLARRAGDLLSTFFASRRD